MAITDSQQGPGTLTLGGTDYGVQISNVRLEANKNTEEGTPTLGVPKPAAIVTTTWSLIGGAIQDWEDAAGFIKYAFDNDGVEVAFSWVPVSEGGPTFAGQCVVSPITIGGDIATQLISDWEFPVSGEPTWTPGGQRSATSSK